MRDWDNELIDIQSHNGGPAIWVTRREYEEIRKRWEREAKEKRERISNITDEKRQEILQKIKDESEWESGNVAKSTTRFKEFLEKGYKPTYKSCGGAFYSEKNIPILKLACQYGLEPEEATKILIQTKNPEAMEILVKEGKADVCKYPVTNIFSIGQSIYEEIKQATKNNEGNMATFKKLVELGYKPETPKDTKIFEYVTKELKRYETEQKRRDSEIEKIGDCPLGQKLLASALIKAGIMKDHTQIDSIYDILTTDNQRQEFNHLQQEGIMSEKFEILKPWEFRNSKIFTSKGFVGDDVSDIENIPAIKKFIDETEKQHEVAENKRKYEEQLKALTEDNLSALFKTIGRGVIHPNVIAHMEALPLEKQGKFYPYYKKVMKSFEAHHGGYTSTNFAIAEKQYVNRLENFSELKEAVEMRACGNPQARIAEVMTQKIYDDTKLQDIVAEIKQMDQKTINYLANYMAKYPATWRPNALSSNNEIKSLAVSLAIYDRSTGTSKNMLQSELLKARTGYYRGEDRKEMLNIFQKAKKMLKGEITEDVTVKGLTRKSYTPYSSLNKALRECNTKDK